MSTTTVEALQAEYDNDCDKFKKLINEHVANLGFDSISKCIASGKGSELITDFCWFQDGVNPSAESMGVKTKSLSEVFGTEITLTAR